MSSEMRAKHTHTHIQKKKKKKRVPRCVLGLNSAVVATLRKGSECCLARWTSFSF